MKHATIGFIGGGRVTRIILDGLRRKDCWPGLVAVSDTNVDVLNKLKERFPSIEIHQGYPEKAAAMDIVFISLHPPMVGGVLSEIKTHLKSQAVMISLAPKVAIAQLSAGLGGFRKIVRMIPNAPSIVNKGYNPVAFSSGFDKEEKKDVVKWLECLGDCPEVKEDKLEAYAILTAMGPTYLWFQLAELQAIGQSFGLTAKEVERGISKMVKGAVKTLYGSGLSPTEVIDLVPVKPLAEEEEMIRNAYQTRLTGLYGKLKG